MRERALIVQSFRSNSHFRGKTCDSGNAFWNLQDETNRLHAAHESFSSLAMLAEVPLAGLSFHRSSIRVDEGPSMRQTSESNPRLTLNRSVNLPEGARPLRINLPYLIVIGAVHVLSLLVLDPWYFSWAGVLSLVFGYFLFGILGITVGFHRLLSHRSFECPKWFEYCLALLGTCCLQESAAYAEGRYAVEPHWLVIAGQSRKLS